MVDLECAGLTALGIGFEIVNQSGNARAKPTRRQAGALQIVHAGPNPQLSELRRGDFIRCAAMSILRIEACDDRLRVVLRHAVHWQQALSSLRRGRGQRYARSFAGLEMSAMRNRYEVDDHRQRARARMRSVWRALA